MTIIDDDLLAEFRAAKQCELCGDPTPNGADPHHIRARGRGSAFRMDTRINLLAAHRDCHTCIGNGSRLPRGPWAGACLRTEQQLEIVHHREGIPLEADLYMILCAIIGLDKAAQPNDLRMARRWNDDEAAVIETIVTSVPHWRAPKEQKL